MNDLKEKTIAIYDFISYLLEIVVKLTLPDTANNLNMNADVYNVY